MRTLLAFALVVTALAGHPSEDVRGRSADSPPALTEFIELVRGYDAPTIRRTFPAYNTGLFERLFGSGPPIPLNSERAELIFAEQLVRTPAGVVIDIGHVATGLEAAGPLPPAARLVEATTGCSMRAAVTWSGDVGQALIDYILAGMAGDPARFFDRHAPAEDLLGDLDGFVLGGEVTGTNADVAAVLTRSYVEGNLEATRFQRFLDLLGDDPRAAAMSEISCYARAFARLAGVSVEPASLISAAPYFVERFVAFLEDGRAAEAR